MDSLIRRVFLFFLERTHASRAAAMATTLIALFFAPTLLRRPRSGGRIIEGEFRRLGD